MHNLHFSYYYFTTNKVLHAAEIIIYSYYIKFTTTRNMQQTCMVYGNGSMGMGMGMGEYDEGGLVVCNVQ